MNLTGIALVDKAASWLFLIGIAIIPIIVGVKKVTFISPKIISTLYNTGQYGNMYSFYKFSFLLFLTIIVTCLLLVKIFIYKYELQKSYINISLLILAVLTLISGLKADYLNISLFGMYDRYEGLITYLCYFALLFAAANTKLITVSVKYLPAALSIFIIINLVLVLYYCAGKEIIQYPVVRTIVGLTYIPTNQSVSTLNSTLGNPNFVSGYCGALTAFFLMGTLLYTGKKRVYYAVLSVLSFTIILGSLSTSGFLSFLAILPVIAFIAFMKKRELKTVLTSLIILSCFCISFLFVYSLNSRVWDESIGFFSGKAKSLANEIFTQPNDTNEFNLPEIKQTASSGRIYIWSKTIKLIKEHPLLGYGHDTLLYNFPQYDADKAEYLGPTTLITKPHNMYLEVAYGSGLIALAAFLVLLILHLFQTLKNIIKGNNDNVMFLATLFTFWCAFLLQWLFNDSLIGTSPVFWILFGFAVAINNSVFSQKQV